MSYLSLILAILSLVDKFTDWAIERKWLAEGARREIAKVQAESIRKSGYAKEVMAEVDAMSDDAVDDGLRHLEPGERDKPGS